MNLIFTARKRSLRRFDRLDPTSWMFSSGFSEMLINLDNVDLMYCAMGGQQCKQMERPSVSKRVYVQHEPESLTLLDECFICSPPKRARSLNSSSHEGATCNFVVKCRESQAFNRLLEDPTILEFLQADQCRRISDKYLIAMVFTYFKRAEYEIYEYTRMNFFVALYLANDMEEDDEDVKYDIFPWALGERWRSRYVHFFKKREKLWQRIDYRAVVSKKCCEEIMNIDPAHWAWKRERAVHHGGATRIYRFFDEEEECYVRGPGSTPRQCDKCFGRKPPLDSGYFDETSWYLSESFNSESEPSPEFFYVDHQRSLIDLI